MSTADSLDLPDLPGALCIQVGSPELWFPTLGQKANEAKAVCRRCPEREPCLAYALAHDVTGVWAGTTEEYRQNWRRDNSRRAVSMSTERIVGTHSRGQRGAAA